MIADQTTGAPELLPAFNDREQKFVAGVKQFVEDYVLPNTRAWEEATSFPDEIWSKLAERELLAMTVPTSMGGAGLSCRAYVEACRTLATGDPALAMNVAAINALCLAHFVHFATDE